MVSQHLAVRSKQSAWVRPGVKRHTHQRLVAVARRLHVRTAAASRDDYLAHPATGERLRDDDARAVARLYPARPPQVQVVLSDGLNANAVNEQLRALLPPLRRLLSDGGCDVGESDIIVQNGRPLN